MTRSSRPEGRPGGVGTPQNRTPDPRQAELPDSIDDECAFALAEVVLERGEPIGCAVHRILAVPDVTLLQGIANGMPAPDAWRLRRGDGRAVAIFALPEGWSR